MTATAAATALKMTRFIQAPRQKVYEAWLRPELLNQWMGGPNTTVPVFKADLRVGGKYHLEMQSTAGKRYVVEGAYQELVPGEKLVFTWVSATPVTGDSLVTLHFRDKDGGTEMTLIHERFASAEAAEQHRKGWTESFEKMAALLGG
ncbi:MAG: SRPBCC family protein [Gemmatimonadales bacterium]